MQHRLSKKDKEILTKKWKTGRFGTEKLGKFFKVTPLAIRGLLKRRGFKIPKLTTFQKGHIPWSKGTKGLVGGWNRGLTKEIDKRAMDSSIRMKKNNPMKRKEVRNKVSKSNTGHKLSDETRKKMSESKKGKTPKNINLILGINRKGNKNPNWKGGVSPINRLIRESAQYRKWREEVFKRDKYTCVMCGQIGGNLNADHIKRFSDFPELRFSIDNGRTLCEKCHRKTETWGNKLKHKNIKKNV